MLTLKEIDEILAKEFQIALFKESAINGIQIGKESHPIKTVALAVDATIETVRKAVSINADLLITHHGIFWGHTQPIKGAYFDLIQTFIQNNCALYSLHLPLDSHQIYGNNAQLSKLIFKETPYEPFFFYKGNPIGVKLTVEDLSSGIEILKAHFPYLKLFHLEHLSSNAPYKVGILSGQISFDMLEDALNDLDLVITGEVNLPIYNKALENQFPLITLGHYYSERLGVISLKEILKSYDNSLKCFFIEEIKPI